MIRIFFPTDFLFTQNLLSVTVCWKLKEKKQGKIFLCQWSDIVHVNWLLCWKSEFVLNFTFFNFKCCNIIVLSINLQSKENSSNFTIDKRASIPLEIFFFLKKASEIVMVNFIHSPEVVLHTLYLHLCQHQKIVCHVIKISMASTWHCWFVSRVPSAWIEDINGQRLC